MPEIEFIIRRHADKAKGGEQWQGRTLVKDEVSPKGYGQAKRAGAKYSLQPPSVVLRRVTNLIRTRQTSDTVVQGTLEAAATLKTNAKITTIPAREDANFFGVSIADKDRWAQVAAKGEDPGIRAFLKGENVGFTETPRQLGERYFAGVRSLFGKVQKHFQKKPEKGYLADKYVVDITAHAPGIGALAAYLMGRHEPDGSVKLATASLLKVPERLTEEIRVKINTDANGLPVRAVAVFRGRQKDVTHLFTRFPKLSKERFGPGGWYSPHGQ